jgi:hypothetical protein
MAVENESGAKRRATSKKGTSSNSGASAASTRKRSRAKSSSGTRGSSATRAKSGSGSAKRTTSRSGSTARKSANPAVKAGSTAAERVEGLFNSRSVPQSASNGASLVKTAIDKAVVPLATATVGVAGGIVIGRSKLQRRKALVNVPAPPRKLDFHGLSQQVGEAGRQFARLAQEVHAVREKAEKIGRAIS